MQGSANIADRQLCTVDDRSQPRQTVIPHRRNLVVLCTLPVSKTRLAASRVLIAKRSELETLTTMSDAAARGVRHKRPAKKSGNGASPSDIAAAKRLGLRHVSTAALSIRRRRCGRGWAYLAADSRPIRDPKLVRRLARLAVPPAYEDVLYAKDPAAHLQAVGRDAAGRLQYRYHPQWEDVREQGKARRLARLADALTLRFRSKGGKLVTKELPAPRLAKAIARLRQLPGRRLFRYRAENGNIRSLTAHEVNAFLREIAGVRISLKDFRTLLASASVLEALAHAKPAPSERQRRKQVREAVQAAADDLANTVTICRKSYVHDAVVTAFEDGALGRYSKALKECRSPVRRAKILAKIVTTELSS
jgi:DNA topoisomerase IB